MNALNESICVVPAYGRMYNKKETMVNDWNEGKDFKILSGPYCSIRDLETMKKEFGIVYVTDGVHTFEA